MFLAAVDCTPKNALAICPINDWNGHFRSQVINGNWRQQGHLNPFVVVQFQWTPVNLFSMNYREGSLTVMIKMTFDAMVSDEQARALLEGTVSSGWLGRFEVNKSSVESIASERNEVTPPGKGNVDFCLPFFHATASVADMVERFSKFMGACGNLRTVR